MTVASGNISNIPFDSITSSTYTFEAVDRIQPLSFIQWLPYNSLFFTTTEDSLKQYQAYINAWYVAKGEASTAQEDAIKMLYLELINEITINYTTHDERRFLKNLDKNNPRDLAIAIPFFSKKIRDICLYYSTLRDDAQTATLQYNLKGSNAGIEGLLYNTISRALEAEEIQQLSSTLSLNLSNIRGSVTIDVEDIYDTYANYFDVSPTLPASAYNTTQGLRYDYFSANQNNIDPFLTLDFNQSIINAIFKYPFYLIEIGEAFTINKATNATELNLLKDSDYIGGVNNGNTTDLNIIYNQYEQSKYIGADFYYVVTDSTLTSFTSGQLFAADSEFANVLNKRYPTVAAIPSQEFLKTGKELGLFFKPDKIGLLHFTNFKFSASVDLTNLAPNTVYYFPDPKKYGNVSGGTKQNFLTPLSFFEENYFNKVDFSNEYRMGDVDTDPYYQLFRSYQSREQTLDNSSFGLSRYTDSQDFFTGDEKDIWNNIDVYPLINSCEFPIDNRIQDLLTLNKTLVQYKNDIYGNEYGLYKSSYPLKTPSLTAYPQTVTHIILNGWLFNDPVSGYNFNYDVVDPTKNYSGVTLNTNGFSALTNPLTIRSYGFATEIFTPSYVRTTFNCGVKDGQTFVSPTGALLPGDRLGDIPTDNLLFDPLKSSLYYDELVDASIIPNDQPTYNAGLLAKFTPVPQSYTVILYDCNNFLVDYNDEEGNLIIDAEPCTDNVSFNEIYSEPINLIEDIRLPYKTTTLDYSITATQEQTSLYNARNVDYGDFFFRAPGSTVIQPISAALSASFVKYPIAVSNEINTSTINFDVYYDALQIETENYLVFEKLSFDHNNTNQHTGSVFNIITRGATGVSLNPELEKFANTWFIESTKQLIVCKTALLADSSTTNYKIIYPKISILDLDNLQSIQVYPRERDDLLTFDELSIFSLSNKDIELDIVEIEKPLLNFNNDTNTYILSYIARDTAYSMYIVHIKFNYINGIVNILSTTLYKPTFDVIHQNFGNPTVSALFETYSILGNIVGYVDQGDDTFTFISGSFTSLLQEDGSYILQENGGYILA